MTDVPFGRGGSPLQNLIVRGLRETKFTALRMSGEFDAGPVYMKEVMPLEGGAEEIYLRASRLSGEMIERIIRLEPKPAEQKGEAKIAAMESYESEARKFPYPRSPEALRALAAWRGSTVGCAAADAFALVRAIRPQGK